MFKASFTFCFLFGGRYHAAYEVTGQLVCIGSPRGFWGANWVCQLTCKMPSSWPDFTFSLKVNHVLIMYNNGVHAISCMYIMPCHNHSPPLTVSCPLPCPTDLLFPASPSTFLLLSVCLYLCDLICVHLININSLSEQYSFSIFT